MKKKTGICRWCNKVFPIREEKVVAHFKPGTRKPCAPDKWQHTNLPVAEYPKGQKPKKWKGCRGFAEPTEGPNTLSWY